MAQLNMREREIVSQLWAAGHSRKAIAERLGRSRSTISRELKRNGAADGSYWAVTAQEQAVRRRRQRPLVRKLQRPELNAAVRSRLSRAWSPDQIAGRLRKDHPANASFHVAPQTIYAWVEQDEHQAHWQSFFRRGGRPPGSTSGGSSSSPRSSSGRGSGSAEPICTGRRRAVSGSTIRHAISPSRPRSRPPRPARRRRPPRRSSARSG